MVGNKHKSALGNPVDWETLRAKNQHVVAVGNAKMNARGDIVDSNGKILKTAEQYTEEYNERNENAVRHVSIKNDAVQPDEFVSPEEALKQATEQAQEASKSKNSKRKIKDSEE